MAAVAYGVHCQVVAIAETVVRHDGFVGCFATVLTSKLFAFAPFSLLNGLRECYRYRSSILGSIAGVIEMVIKIVLFSAVIHSTGSPGGAAATIARVGNSFRFPVYRVICS